MGENTGKRYKRVDNEGDRRQTMAKCVLGCTRLDA
jgi:hypothetical protein